MKSYPYPVLGIADDVVGEFRMILDYVINSTTIAVAAEFILDNITLEEMIKDKSAVYVVDIECSQTFFRKIYTSSEQLKVIEIPESAVRGRIDIACYIVSTKTIQNYINDESHPDYRGYSFKIEKGDILAEGGKTYIIADKDFDPMKSPVESLIKIRAGSKNDGPIDISYFENQIYVELSKKDYELYKTIGDRGRIAGVLHASIALPVVIDAVYKVKSEDEDFKNYIWYAKLDQMIKTRNLENEDEFKTAQILLGLPETRSLELIKLMDINDGRYDE